MVRRSYEHLASGLEAYADLLLKLHNLISQGKGESENSDAIRDHMDVYWKRLDEGDREIARQLSADLYSLDDTIANSHPQGDVYSAELAAEIGKARENNDFAGALRLLAERAPEISYDRAAILRGMIYRELGLVQIGLAFMWHVANSSPTPESAHVIVLNTLWHYVGVDTAATCAMELLREKKVTGITFFVVAGILLMAATSNEGFVRRQYADASKSLLTEMLKSAPDDEAKAAQAKCHEMLSNCYYLIGESTQAIKELDIAIQLYPSDDEPYVQRGLMLLDSHFEKAKSDFEQASKLGTSSVWPYYYLAFDAFRSQCFARCIQLSTTALSRTSDLETLARLHELLAMSIASANSTLSQSTIEAIRSHFRTGISLSPGDQQILENFHVFENALQNAIRQHGWVIRPPVASRRATAFVMSERLPELAICR